MQTNIQAPKDILEHITAMPPCSITQYTSVPSPSELAKASENANCGCAFPSSKKATIISSNTNKKTVYYCLSPARK